MIKKTKKRGPKVRHVREEESDDSSDEEETVRHRRRGGHVAYAQGLAHYDLAVPMRAQPMGMGMGMGAANFVVGARPMMMAPMAMAPVSGMPMMATTAATFQPTYGSVMPMM